jgi:hypothetical protein
MPTFDCKTNTPIVVPPPVYFQCWGTRVLPSYLNFTAGPTTLIPPNTIPCMNWPTTQVQGQMGRGFFGTNLCRTVWSVNIGGTPGFTLFFGSKGQVSDPNFNYLPLDCQINMPDLTQSWFVGTLESGVITYSSVTGSCSQNPLTGIVTLNYSATISNGLCSLPVSISFVG